MKRKHTGYRHMLDDHIDLLTERRRRERAQSEAHERERLARLQREEDEDDDLPPKKGR